jgi:hypothetical protein
LILIPAGFVRWNAIVRRADRQRQLDVAKPALIAIHEILQEECNIKLLPIATLAQLIGDIGANVLRPVLGGVEGNHPDRALILTGQKVENNGLSTAALSSVSRRPGRVGQVCHHQVDVTIVRFGASRA